ncbi:MAG: ABC transporter permease [Caldiserica bacterium]|jgi:ABC-2 type transport system permease protein|nr:ABC transporter permease [Caldisericota bacterium]MDH7562124.1 ABC transporter permease [Caldisericota bacterium]
MRELRVFFRKELKEGLKSWRVPIMLVVFFILGISSPLLFKFMPALIPPELKSAFEQFMKPTFEEMASSLAKNLSQIGVLVIILFFMGSVAEEKGKGQLELLFARPIPRSSLIWAKFLAGSIAIILCLAISFLAFALYFGVLFPQEIPLKNLAWGFFLFSLFFILVLSFTLFSSTLFSSGLWAGLLSGSFFLLLSFLPSLGEKFSRYSPSGLLESANLIMRGQGASFGDSLMVTVVGILIFTLLASIVLERQEF